MNFKKGNYSRVVLTGIGVIAPNGLGVLDFWYALEHGKSGIKRVDSFDVSNFRCQVAGEVTEFQAAMYMDGNKWERMDRFAQFGVVAGQMALRDAQLTENMANEKRGVSIGCSIGGMVFYEKNLESFIDRGPKGVNPAGLSKTMPNSVAGNMAIELNLKGLNLTISTACSSSLHSIGLAFDAIRIGRSKVVLAGGTETPITPLTFAAFDSMRVMSTSRNAEPMKACMPFDRGRDGLVLGEGAAILVLEELEHAMNRGARIYGEIAGYGSNNGTYHIVAPDPTGVDAVDSMKEALVDAHLQIEDVDYVNAHGTATKANDKAEATAIRKLFGTNVDNLPVSSTKSMIGHTVGAAGAFGVVASLMAIYKGIIHPTINFSEIDPECELDCTPNIAKRKDVEVALVNAFGFGSNNACVILQRFVE